MRPDHGNYSKKFILYLEVAGLVSIWDITQFTLVVPVNKKGIKKLDAVMMKTGWSPDSR